MGVVRFITWLFTNAIALAVAAQLFDGIRFDGPTSGWDEIKHKILPLLFVALIMGIVTSFVSPIVKLLSLPFIIITLGLFLLVINALMLLFTEWLAGLFDIGFHVDGFWTAVWGSIVITVVGWFVGLLLGDTREH